MDFNKIRSIVAGAAMAMPAERGLDVAGGPCAESRPTRHGYPPAGIYTVKEGRFLRQPNRTRARLSCRRAKRSGSRSTAGTRPTATSTWARQSTSSFPTTRQREATLAALAQAACIQPNRPIRSARPARSSAVELADHELHELSYGALLGRVQQFSDAC